MKISAISTKSKFFGHLTIKSGRGSSFNAEYYLKFHYGHIFPLLKHIRKLLPHVLPSWKNINRNLTMSAQTIFCVSDFKKQLNLCGKTFITNSVQNSNKSACTPFSATCLHRFFRGHPFFPEEIFCRLEHQGSGNEKLPWGAIPA